MLSCCGFYVGAEERRVQTIKSKSELPDWFKSKVYSKKLSATDWYREIVFRQLIGSSIEMFENNDRNWSEKSQTTLMKLFFTEANKTSPIFYLNQHDKPIQPLSVIETLYLAKAMNAEHSDILSQKLEKIIKMWKVEVARTDDSPIYSREYEMELRESVEFIQNNETASLDILSVSEIGNPFLSWDRPLNGTPVTIDTQFDDQTIIESVKKWLENERTKLNEKAKRPFNQNDFDDWVYFKIREVFDLETWSKIARVKILDKVIADALWPHADGEISPIDILRTTVRKKVKDVFNFQIATRLYGQLKIQEGENFLEK